MGSGKITTGYASTVLTLDYGIQYTLSTDHLTKQT